jgi:hypothetical protein
MITFLRENFAKASLAKNRYLELKEGESRLCLCGAAV